MEIREKHDQYFLKNHSQYKDYLSKINHHFINKKIIEFGVGHGEISHLILTTPVKEIIGFEIDTTLKIKPHPNLTVLYNDFEKYSFSSLKIDKHWVIANPPYKSLPFISHYVKQECVEGYVLIMTELWKNDFFPESEIIGEINAHDFFPLPRGKHIVVFHKK